MTDVYIRAQDAIDAVHEEFDGCTVWDESGKRTADEVESIIDRVSPANVVPVVWCKDCKLRRVDGYCTKFQNNISGIATSWFMPNDIDFCSYGKKREEE